MNPSTIRSDELPFISCVMPTYGRPDYVDEAIWFFLEQDYPSSRKELIVLNDCPGQTIVCDMPRELGVQIINRSERYPTLGEKRNACIELAKGELIAVWDDDDVYLPWRLSYSLRQMRMHNTSFYRASEFWAYWGEEELHHNQSTRGWVSHPNTLYTKELWQQVGGYPAKDVGEDGGFFDAVHAHLGSGFLTYPISERDRFFVLRGQSRYAHMCMPGGQSELDKTSGTHRVVPHSLRDPLLMKHYDRLVRARHFQSNQADCPLLSVCISLKNRSRVSHGDGFLSLLPNAVKSLAKAAHETNGQVELVISDFYSDDLPPEQWIDELADGVVVRVLKLDGGFSRGRGLNEAVRAASSDRLLLMDADVLVDAHVLHRSISLIDEGKAWFPIFHCLDESGQPDFWQDFTYGISAVHRNLFEAAGGVPEFESWGGEDDLFHEQVAKHAEVIRERCVGLRHQWHPENIRHKHYSRPRKSDYLALFSAEETTSLSVINSSAESVGEAIHAKRLKVCNSCSMNRGLISRNGADINCVLCIADGGEVSLSTGRCRLRKWPNKQCSEDALSSSDVVNPALLVIATGRYYDYIEPLLLSARKYMFPKRNIAFYVFSDKPFIGDGVTWIKTSHAPWPDPSLYMAKTILRACEYLRKHDFLVLSDADMRFVGPVDGDIVGDLFAVKHPHFTDLSRQAFTYETNPRSKAYVRAHEGQAYYAGGFQGGRTKHYLAALKVMADSVDQDAQNGITAIWHDESHWNRYLIDRPPDVVLDTRYCCPETWGIHDRRVLALDKDHEALRRDPDPFITFTGLGYQGQLGNQMFQYAMLMGVAHTTGRAIHLTEDNLSKGLECFNLDAHTQVKHAEPIHNYAEQAACFHYDPTVADQPDGTNYSGYFQSYRYFEHIADLVRKQFCFKDVIQQDADRWWEKVTKEASGRPVVGVHVRRGDYLSRPDFYRPFEIEDYRRARKLFGNEEVLYLVYSDDPAWCRQHFQRLDEYVLGDLSSAVTMCVASRCSHFINSASTFSWWVAWLGTNPQKIVAVPSPWFGSSYPWPETGNQMCPPEWIRLNGKALMI